MSATPLAPLFLSVALWSVWSLVIGCTANRLPIRWLTRTLDDPLSRDQVTAGLCMYEQHLVIRFWKPWIPDAGALLPGGIRKADLARRSSADLQRLIAETWRAELVHQALWPAWLVTALWLPPRGVLLNLIFATVFNLPCILLQRYNRLRIIRLLHRFGASGRQLA